MRAVFLDRDGTLIEDRGYLATVDGVRLLPGVTRALKMLADHHLTFVVVTNQSGIGRGLFDEEMVEAQHRAIAERLRRGGVRVAAWYVCPHLPDAGCSCRKPQPGMLLAAARDLGVSLSASFMVGDRATDVDAGRAAGCRTVRLAAAQGQGDACCRDLTEAAEWIIAHLD